LLAGEANRHQGGQQEESGSFHGSGSMS